MPCEPTMGAGSWYGMIRPKDGMHGPFRVWPNLGHVVCLACGYKVPHGAFGYSKDCLDGICPRCQAHEVAKTGEPNLSPIQSQEEGI